VTLTENDITGVTRNAAFVTTDQLASQPTCLLSIHRF
jgi:hypothetical protein